MTSQAPITPPENQARISEQSTYYYQDDEISLIDMWLVLDKRKRLGMSIFAIVVLLAGLYSFFVSTKYHFTTTIEIGTRVLNDKIISIEAPVSLLAKVNESYIPQVLLEYMQSNPKQDYCEIEARIPTGSEIIVLESKAKESLSESCMQLHSIVVAKIQSDHQQINNLIKGEARLLQSAALNQLEELKDRSRLLIRKEARYNELLTLLKNQLVEVERLLKSTSIDRGRAVSEVKGEAKAMTLLLLDSGIQNLIERQSKLEERIQIETADKMDEISKVNADNARAQLEQKDKIAQLKISLLNIRDTRAIVPPMRSLNAAGLGVWSIMMISIVVGGLLAVFLMFFAEFQSKVKEKLANNDQANNTHPI